MKTSTAFVRRNFIGFRCFNRTFSTRIPVVGGNWKLNAGKGTSKADVADLVAGINSIPKVNYEVFIAPPAIYLEYVLQNITSNIEVAAQNVYSHSKGAYTGENSAEMILDLGVSWTIVGHSERRDLFGEGNELIGQKIALCQKLGITTIACIGEHKDSRESGMTMDVLKVQLEAITASTLNWDKIVIAYEPVWAIGTGLVATPEQAQETCANIREWISRTVSSTVAESVRIQYGGSVNPENAAGLAAMSDIDGFLVGGACLKAESFAAILRAF